MALFFFRETRLESNLPIWVSLQVKSSQKILPGRIEATLINVSRGGACLFTPTLLIEGTHLFFTTLNSSNLLLLQVHESADHIDDFLISARSIWMDSCLYEGRQHFKVGLCFTTPQKQLFETVKKHYHHNG